AWIARMVPVDSVAGAGAGSPAQLYAANCSGCHGAGREGTGDRGPALVGVGERRTADEIRRVVRQGAGFMPPFGHLPEAEREAIVEYLLSEGGGATPQPTAAAAVARPDHEVDRAEGAPAPGSPSPYRFAGYEKFLDPDGYPALRPPW